MTILEEAIDSTMRINQPDRNDLPGNTETRIRIAMFCSTRMLKILTDHGKAVFAGECDPPSQEEYNRLEYLAKDVYKKANNISRTAKQKLGDAKSENLANLNEILVRFKVFLENWTIPKLAIGPAARMAKKLPEMAK